MIPSFVAAFWPARVLRRARHPLRAARRRTAARGRRAIGAALVALTLSTYPYVYLLTAVDPPQRSIRHGEGGGPGPRRASGPWSFARVTLPALRPSVAVGALLVALYVLSDFGVVSLMGYDDAHDGHLRPLRVLLRAAPAAILALVLVALDVSSLSSSVQDATSRTRSTGSSPGSQRRQPTIRLGKWHWPGTRVLLARRRALPRPPCRRARLVVASADAITGPRLRRGPIAAGAPLPRCRRRLAAGAAIVALFRPPFSPGDTRRRSSRRLERLSYCGECAARHRGRALARLRRRALAIARLPEPRPAPRVRVRRALHAVRPRRRRGVRPRAGEPATRGGRARRSAAVRSAHDGVRHLPARPLRSARWRRARLPEHAIKELPATLLLRADRLRDAGDRDLEGNCGRRVLAGALPALAAHRDRGATRLPPLLAESPGSSARRLGARACESMARSPRDTRSTSTSRRSTSSRSRSASTGRRRDRPRSRRASPRCSASHARRPARC